MTYLATEMLLYMLAAAAIGLVLGWLIGGLGRRRKLEKLRSDLTSKLESEMMAHDKARVSLEKADARMKEAVDEAKAEAGRSAIELQQSLDEERLKASEAEAGMERLRAEVEETLHQGRVSGQEAIDNAMRIANVEKAAAAEAMAREAQSRAQIEELRLLIGAEKLAAETARAELEKTRAELQAEIATERAAHQQAKVALNDIRSTLARTLGADVMGVTGGGDAGAGLDRPTGTTMAPAAKPASPAFSLMTDMTAAGEALNNLDLDEADIEDRDDGSLELPPTFGADDDPAAPTEVVEAVEVVDPPVQPSAEKIELRPIPTESVDPVRPPHFLEQRPDQVDDLTAIHGIDAEMERRLQDQGCYRYRQLADLKPEHIEWLARAIDVTTYQIKADRWVQQAMAEIDDGDDSAGAGEDQDRPFIGEVSQKSAG